MYMLFKLFPYRPISQNIHRKWKVVLEKYDLAVIAMSDRDELK